MELTALGSQLGRIKVLQQPNAYFFRADYCLFTLLPAVFACPKTESIISIISYCLKRLK